MSAPATDYCNFYYKRYTHAFHRGAAHAVDTRLQTAVPNDTDSVFRVTGRFTTTTV